MLVVGVAIGSATWMAALASGVAVVRRAVGPRAIRIADGIAGLGLLGFGGVLAYGARARIASRRRQETQHRDDATRLARPTLRAALR